MPPVPRPDHSQALARIYIAAARRLRLQIRAALERGAIGTAAYRQRQLEAVQAELRRLGRRSTPIARSAAIDAYLRGVSAVEVARAGRGGEIGIRFTGSHRRAVDAIARNLEGRLTGAIDTVGRRTDDAFRRVGLEQVGQGAAAGASRREISAAVERRLVDEGVTDALTGFVDAAGKRWQLDVYAEMVGRTTLREAVSSGTANRLLDLNQRLITISAHGTSCEICQPYEGQTYSLPGYPVDGYDEIDQLPPFHPNCLHVATPAEADADLFIGQLQRSPIPEVEQLLGVSA